MQTRAKAATCGHKECTAANTRWHKLQWWHKHRGKRKPAHKIAMVGSIPEMDYSGSAVVLNIPEVDTSDMTDTRKSSRVNM